MSRRSSRIEEQQKLKQATTAKPVAVTRNVKKASKAGKATKNTSQRGSSSKSKPNKKKRKLIEPEKPTNPKQRGYLEQFAKEAPLDVMVEIFSHLWPREILYLSRTSKSLRRMLMSRSYASIWRTARNNAGLPPLPQDLSEPQYASLAFDPYCYACGRGPCDTIFWSLRIKCHKKCFNDLLCPWSRLPRVVEGWSEDVAAMVKLGIKKEFLPYLFGTTSYFLPSTIVSFYSEYKKVKHDAESLKDWSSRKRREYKGILKHQKLCEEWHRKKIEDRKTEIADLRFQRANEIIGRLSEDGWEVQDLRSLEHSHYASIYQPVEFDEYTWPATHAYLTQALTGIKAERLKQEERGAYADRHRVFYRVFDALCKEGSPFATMPLGDVLFSSAKINELLWRPLCEEEQEDLDALENEFKKVLKDELPGIFQDWTGGVEKQLISILQKEIPSADVETLNRANSVFQCRYCRKLLWYPFLIGHYCFRYGGREDHHLDRKPESVPSFVNPSKWRSIFDPFRESAFGWNLWCMNSADVLFSRNLYKRTRSILSLCGFDSKTSIDVMLKADPFLECSGCTPDGYVKVMRWTTTILHHDRSPTDFPVLSILDQSRPEIQAVILKAYRGEESRTIQMGTRGGVRREHFSFLCKICRGTTERFDFMSYHTLRVHMKDRHDIGDEDAMDGNWELSPGSGLGLHPAYGYSAENSMIRS
ncbi:hypothetical protein L218DRAFT_985136 [Marasmius fiardii PR-910]|nr:hypothetical protein L218DRAFT_985136 [Marasmius fiardii PR-910]